MAQAEAVDISASSMSAALRASISAVQSLSFSIVLINGYDIAAP
jgi:hypothetical protein